MMYSGNDSVYTYTFEHMKKDDCPVCGNLATDLKVKPTQTLYDFIEWLKDRPDASAKRPSLSTGSAALYLQSPPQLEEQTRPNLEKPLADLVSEGDELVITDPALPFSLRYNIYFSE
jgi:ubiquitin-activating enzyme E1 C